MAQKETPEDMKDAEKQAKTTARLVPNIFTVREDRYPDRWAKSNVVVNKANQPQVEVNEVIDILSYKHNDGTNAKIVKLGGNQKQNNRQIVHIQYSKNNQPQNKPSTIHSSKNDAIKYLEQNGFKLHSIHEQQLGEATTYAAARNMMTSDNDDLKVSASHIVSGNYRKLAAQINKNPQLRKLVIDMLHKVGGAEGASLAQKLTAEAYAYYSNKQLFSGVEMDDINEDRYLNRWAKAKASANKANQPPKVKPMKVSAPTPPEVNHENMAFHISTSIGDCWPDCDPYERMAMKYPKLHNTGSLTKHMDIAAKKHLKAKSFGHYVKDVWDEMNQMNPEVSQGTNPYESYISEDEDMMESTTISRKHAEEGAALASRGAELMSKSDWASEHYSKLNVLKSKGKKFVEKGGAKVSDELPKARKASDDAFAAEHEHRKLSDDFEKKHGVSTISAWEAHHNKPWPHYKVMGNGNFHNRPQIVENVDLDEGIYHVCSMGKGEPGSGKLARVWCTGDNAHDVEHMDLDKGHSRIEHVKKSKDETIAYLKGQGYHRKVFEDLEITDEDLQELKMPGIGFKLSHAILDTTPWASAKRVYTSDAANTVHIKDTPSETLRNLIKGRVAPSKANKKGGTVKYGSPAHMQINAINRELKRRGEATESVEFEEMPFLDYDLPNQVFEGRGRMEDGSNHITYVRNFLKKHPNHTWDIVHASGKTHLTFYDNNNKNKVVKRIPLKEMVDDGEGAGSSGVYHVYHNGKWIHRSLYKSSAISTAKQAEKNTGKPAQIFHQEASGTVGGYLKPKVELKNWKEETEVDNENEYEIIEEILLVGELDEAKLTDAEQEHVSTKGMKSRGITKGYPSANLVKLPYDTDENRAMADSIAKKWGARKRYRGPRPTTNPGQNKPADTLKKNAKAVSLYQKENTHNDVDNLQSLFESWMADIHQELQDHIERTPELKGHEIGKIHQALTKPNSNRAHAIIVTSKGMSGTAYHVLKKNKEGTSFDHAGHYMSAAKAKNALQEIVEETVTFIDDIINTIKESHWHRDPNDYPSSEMDSTPGYVVSTSADSNGATVKFVRMGSVYAPIKVTLDSGEDWKDASGGVQRFENLEAAKSAWEAAQSGRGNHNLSQGTSATQPKPDKSELTDATAASTQESFEASLIEKTVSAIKQNNKNK